MATYPVKVSPGRCVDISPSSSTARAGDFLKPARGIFALPTDPASRKRYENGERDAAIIKPKIQSKNRIQGGIERNDWREEQPQVAVVVANFGRLVSPSWLS